MLPRIRLPHVLLAAGLGGLLVLLVVNISNVVDAQPNDWAAVRSDLRTVLAVLVVLAAGWIALDTIARWLRDLQRGIDGQSWSSRARSGLDETQPQDLGPHLTVLGMAAVARVAPQQVEVPPDNVLAFEMGRRVERERRDR